MEGRRCGEKIGGWIAGKVFTGKLLESDVEIAAEKKRDKDLEGK